MLIIARKPGEAKVGRVGNSLASWAAHQTHNLWQDVGRPGGEAVGGGAFAVCGVCLWCPLAFGLCSICSCSTYHPHPREATNHDETASVRTPRPLSVIAIKTIVVWQIEDTLIVATHHIRPNCVCKVPPTKSSYKERGALAPCN